jgi:hypothetical protein
MNLSLTAIAFLPYSSMISFSLIRNLEPVFHSLHFFWHLPFPFAGPQVVCGCHCLLAKVIVKTGLSGNDNKEYDNQGDRYKR